MENKNIIVERKQGFAVISLNRPEKLNALNNELRVEFSEEIGRLRNDNTVRALIITGAGRAFCSGGDIGGMKDRIEGKEKIWSESDVRDVMRGNSAALRAFDKPVIAAINGVAAGAGLSIALLCDIRIASEKATFSVAFVKRGLVPDTGATWLLPRAVGMERALLMMFSGDTIDAREAERIGLVSKVVTHDALMREAEALASRLAKGPSVAMSLIKRAACNGIKADFDSQLSFEAFAQALCHETEDHREGVRAFMEKREPVFKGK